MLMWVETMEDREVRWYEVSKQRWQVTEEREERKGKSLKCGRWMKGVVADRGQMDVMKC
jgi:hypothetical protein